MGNNVLFREYLFSPYNSSMYTIVVRLMVVSWALTFTNAREAFSSKDVNFRLWEPSEYYMPCSWHDLDWFTPGESNNGVELLPFVYNLMTVDGWSPTVWKKFYNILLPGEHQQLFFRGHLLCSSHDTLPHVRVVKMNMCMWKPWWCSI